MQTGIDTSSSQHWKELRVLHLLWSASAEGRKPCFSKQCGAVPSAAQRRQRGKLLLLGAALSQCICSRCAALLPSPRTFLSHFVLCGRWVTARRLDSGLVSLESGPRSAGPRWADHQAGAVHLGIVPGHRRRTFWLIKKRDLHGFYYFLCSYSKKKTTCESQRHVLPSEGQQSIVQMNGFRNESQASSLVTSQPPDPLPLSFGGSARAVSVLRGI